MLAAHAAIEMPAQRRRAAPRKGAEHASVLRREPRPMHLEEAITVLSNDVGHLKGWRRHRGCSRRDRRAVSGADTGSPSNGLVTACRCRRERWR